MRTSVLFTLLAIGMATVQAADPVPKFAPLMTKPGQLQWQDTLGSDLSKEWKAAKGEWKAVDGAIRVAEKASDMHGAVARRNVSGKNLIVEFTFQLDGTKMASLSVNSPKNHVCRVRLSEKGFVVQKDDTDGKNGPDKGVVLQNVATTIKPGTWNTITIEMFGEEMLARLNGDLVGYGRHAAIDTEKGNIGLTCAGEHLLVKNISVWTAEANSDWAKNKAKIIQK